MRSPVLRRATGLKVLNQSLILRLFGLGQTAFTARLFAPETVGFEKAVNEGMEDMLAILSLAPEVMGINEKALALQLNTDEVDPNRGVFLTREYLRRVEDIYTAKGNARNKY